MDWQGKKVLVLGAGKTGLSIINYLSRKGAILSLSDQKPREAFGEWPEQLAKAGVQLFLGAYPEVTAQKWDLVALSPGIAPSVKPVQQAYAQGIPVWGDLEMAWRETTAPFIAITGTNGKTTTTTLVGEIFKAAGFSTLVAGNIGLPLLDEIEQYQADSVIVAEVSSFQLETTQNFRPAISAILNLTPDHLNRHGDMAGYQEAKARIFAQQKETDFTILNYDDPLTRKMDSPGRVLFFSCRNILEEGAWLENGQLVLQFQGRREILARVEELPIPGEHNAANVLAAWLCAFLQGIGVETVRKTVLAFPGVEHRLEKVAKVREVTYVNDSKGTNPEAAITAIRAFEQPLVLIAGGRNKGNDFTELLQIFKPKGRALIILGECAELLEATAQKLGLEACFRVNSLAEAVQMAAQKAVPGDVVLLSPACASWDMFKNYEERGKLFKRLVQDLT
ncbi:MAG: UDP-N-acetylmuramoyl-L-alanine--D-glutamate ligase [Clostridia bacterium]|nr:UDP-N-acetylmuramoyl-L-alanine--D-glutamate ligase [Clostridia bacterium]